MGTHGPSDQFDLAVLRGSGDRDASAPRIVAISGSTGLIGSALVREYTSAGWEVRTLVRREARASREIPWSPQSGTIDAAKLDGVDVVIHLAGENLAQRWSHDAKRRIRESRVASTALLARTMAALSKRPAVLLSGSAIGIYGSRGDVELDESSPHGDGFLAEVCTQWEAATAPASDASIRVVALRTGLVLSREGGLLPKLLGPFRAGIGGTLGTGRQWMSWISLADHVRAVMKLATAQESSGPVNLVSPNPTTNGEFTDVLGRVLKRPSLLSVPAFAMKLAMGEMAEETALASQRVRPRRLLELGFEFRQPTLESALRSALAA